MTDSTASPDLVDLHIGQRAAVRRRSLGLPPDAVARALGVDETALHDLERGRGRVAARQLWTWSGVLQVPIAWFFKVPAEGPQPSAGVQLIFVPNPDFDWSGDGEPTPIH